MLRNLGGGDLRGFLDQMLTQGQGMLRQGENAAAGRLGVGSDDESRRQMRNTALASGGAGAVLGLLMGSRGGRRMARNAAVIGGVGFLGKLAWDAWQKSQGGGQVGAIAAQPGDRPIHLLEDGTADRRARTLTLAIISAAKADGHIDDAERQAIEGQLESLPEAARGALTAALLRPADPEAVAREAESDQERREIYAASFMLCGKDHPDEVAYMDRLARALNLPPAQVRAIEAGFAQE